MNIQIQPMTQQDLKQIEEILTTDFDEFWTPSIFEKELNNPNSSYFVAKQKNQIVGFGGIWKAVDDIHITNLVTKKNMRNLGIAKQILDKLIQTAKQTKLASLTLEVNENNLPAIDLYEKFGFQKLGIRKKYYNNQDNAIIMTLYFT
jgi:ribosomal-protein-alanine acetyltransferase